MPLDAQRYLENDAYTVDQIIAMPRPEAEKATRPGCLIIFNERLCVVVASYGLAQIALKIGKHDIDVPLIGACLWKSFSADDGRFDGLRPAPDAYFTAHMGRI